MQTLAQIINQQSTPSSDSNPILFRTFPNVEAVIRYFYKSEVEKRGMQMQCPAAKEQIAAAARYLTDRSRKRWLLLAGNVGTGKTTLSAAIRMTLHYYGVPCKMFRASDFPALFLDNTELTQRQILRGEWCEVLLLDDIGVEQADIKFYGNTIQPFVKIVEERYDRRLPLVVSTNLTSAEIGERYGQRTLDRIREMSVGIKYDGQSYRK